MNAGEGQSNSGPGAAIDRLVDEYHLRCLWFLRSDYYPGLTPRPFDLATNNPAIRA
jgi:hypothetical protein